MTDDTMKALDDRTVIEGVHGMNWASKTEDERQVVKSELAAWDLRQAINHFTEHYDPESVEIFRPELETLVERINGKKTNT